MTGARLPAKRAFRIPRAMDSARNVTVWCGFPCAESDENENRPEREAMRHETRPGLPKHPRPRCLSPRVSAGHAADRANAQSIGDMRRGHEANMPSTCVNTEERCSR